VTLLVVAKAPVPGRAKTRLAAGVGDFAAADIAAAALGDTLDAVAATPVAARVVALAGELDGAVNAAEILRQLQSFAVIAQHGNGFADRLVNAHADAATDGHPVLQIGMDTPQVTPELLADCGRQLCAAPVVLGLARDGGWWTLGVHTPASAECLRTVPMSQSNTGVLTANALHSKGFHVRFLTEMADFDVVDDVAAVRDGCRPDSRFARITRAAGL
jgi:glycosyltransferase A (GT-A) superfamily protein (DUF2064 family)